MSPVQARLVPAARGWRWLAEGWRMFRASPVMWLMLVTSYWMLMTLVSIVPFVGVLAALTLVLTTWAVTRRTFSAEIPSPSGQSRRAA